MERKPLLKRLLACALAAAVTVNGFVIPTLAEDDSHSVSFTKVSNDSVSAKFPDMEKVTESEETSPYLDSDRVRVSIVLEDESTIEAGYGVDNIAENAAASSYRELLLENQGSVIAQIEKVTKKDLDVVWNLTLAANLISANVEYGEIEKIEKISGVKEVVIETQYYPDVLSTPLENDPDMATSGYQTGSYYAWYVGYTGAGSRIAIIDTGTDTDHQSFSEEGYLHSLELLAAEAGKELDEYMDELNLLTKAEIDSVKDKLNAGNTKYTSLPSVEAMDSSKAYLNAKLPFTYNYVDGDYDVTHDNDTQGEHGSHVAGIATANAYIKTDTGFEDALDYVNVAGVAPDAQLITMKVFGKNGGAYDSDYMAAIEDAIVLKADSINLSLGSGNPGRSRVSDKTYQAIMDSLTKSGVVVAMSAGNAGSWVENSDYNLAGLLYSDDVSMATNGSPGSYTNSLCVASADNVGTTSQYFEVGGKKIFYTETAEDGDGIDKFATLAGKDVQYVLIDGIGSPEDWAAVGDALKGKVAVCSRGSINFTAKADNALAAGAIATIIYNNTDGTISMSTEGYNHTEPYISITKADAEIMRKAAEKVTVEAAAQADDDAEAAETADASEADESVEAADDAEAAEETADTETAVSDEDAEVSEVTEPVEDTEEAEESEAADAADAQAEEEEEEEVYYYLGTLSTDGKVGSAITDIYAYYYPELSTVSSFSSWGVPGSLELKPEITAPGGNIYSVNGLPEGGTEYENMSGTSMASPQVAGMAAVAAQYIRENKLDEKTKLSARVLAQSLLMSTALPLIEGIDKYDNYIIYPVLRQGAGLANIGNVVTAESYILMGKDATKSWEDGKVKAELGDDPEKTGVYSFSFSVNNITDKPQTYALDADLFTQAPFRYYVNLDYDIGYYMDTTCTLLGSTASFVCDGADVSEITVPANGSKTVSVTLTLLPAYKQDLDTIYDKGAYIEGFVYVDAVEDEEGVVGVSHSIPVLGFYGNWTDPSMYDVGSYIEYKHGDETRLPYLGNTRANFFGITYADEPGSVYYYGGNPLVTDDTYMPERNAINGQSSISMVSFAAIRNAEASYFAVFSDSKPIAATFGAINAAFYHTNQGRWYYTSNTKQVGFVPDDFGFAEGDELEMDLILAPEYYVDDEGNVALDKLGEGAFLTVPMVVDNTEPDVKSVDVDEENGILTVTASDNQYVAAVILYNRTGEVLLNYAPAKQDIAAGATAEYKLALGNIKGTEFYVQVADYAMNVSTYKIDEPIGSNVPVPDMIAFNYDKEAWLGIGTNAAGNKALSMYMPSNKDFIAATIADHYVFAVNSLNELYVMPEDDMDNAIKITDVEYDGICDMAYNTADGKIYAVLPLNSGISVLITIDKLTGEAVPEYAIPFLTNTLACDKYGIFYCNVYGSDMVAAFVLPEDDYVVEPLLLCEEAGIGATRYIQAMEINPNNDMLCWTSMNSDGEAYYVEIDTATGESTVYNDMVLELYALVIPDKSTYNYDFDGNGKVNDKDGTALLDLRVGNRDSVFNEEYADFDFDGDIDTHDAYLFLNKLLWSTPSSEPTKVVLSDEEVKLIKNGRYQITATVSPWNLSDRTVIWTSSDESVAKVDDNGVVTAVGVGSCTITAASKLDRNVSAACDVTVESVNVTITGALQDEEGNPVIFEWDMENDNTWTAVTDLGTYILSAAQSPDGYIYIIDSSANSIYKVDPATGENLEIGAGAKLPLSDFEFSTMFTEGGVPTMTGIYRYLFMTLQDPMNLEDRFYSLQTYLSQVGSSSFVALSSMGKTDFYDDEDDAVYDAERFVAIDDQGLLWNLFVIDSQLWALDVYDSNMPANFLGSNSDMEYCSLTYGDDGYLYLSAHDGDTNNFYRIEVDDENGTCSVMYLGNVGSEVWPAALLSVTTNASAPAATADSFVSCAASKEFAVESINKSAVSTYALTENTSALRDINMVKAVGNKLETEFLSTFAVEPMSFADIAADTDTVAAAHEQIRPMSDATGDKYEIDVELMAQDSNDEKIDSTNGLFIVNYDPKVLDFRHVDSPNGVYNAYRVDEEAGKLIVAYVSPVTPIPAEEAAQIVEFNVTDPNALTKTSIEVIHAEVGNKNYVEDLDKPNAPVDPDDPTPGSGSAPSEDIPIVVTTTEAQPPVFVNPTVPQQPAEETTAPAENPGDQTTGGDTTSAPDATTVPDTTTAATDTTTTAPAVTDDNGGSSDDNNSGDSISLDNSGNAGNNADDGNASNVGNDGDGANASNVGNDGNGANAGDDKNQNTAVVLCIAPAAISAIAVLASKKRRK